MMNPESKERRTSRLILFLSFCLSIGLLFIPFPKTDKVEILNVNAADDVFVVKHYYFPRASGNYFISLEVSSTKNFSFLLLTESEYSNYLTKNTFTALFMWNDTNFINTSLSFSLDEEFHKVLHFLFLLEKDSTTTCIINVSFYRFYQEYALVVLLLGISSTFVINRKKNTKKSIM